jgi:hypothetical protein
MRSSGVDAAFASRMKCWGLFAELPGAVDVSQFKPPAKPTVQSSLF